MPYTFDPVSMICLLIIVSPFIICGTLRFVFDKLFNYYYKQTILQIYLKEINK